MQIAVIGSGYVGLVTAACFAEVGHDVISVDVDASKIEALNRGEIPIHEEFLPELVRRHRGGRLKFSTHVAGAVAASSVVFIAVGTPESESGDADLSYVEAVAHEIARAVDGYRLIVEKSTVPVYTCEWIRRIMALNGVPAGSFDVISNPEFLREGTAVADFLYPDRIVVGADSAKAAAIAEEVYLPLTSGQYCGRPDAIARPANVAAPQMIVTSAKSAELIKHAANAFLALKISYINAIANVCELVGADIEQVCRGIGSDSRIGPRFLQPGIGYGGSCFPKDLKAFRSVAREFGYDFRLLDEVVNINEDQCQRFIRKVRSVLWNLKGKNLGVLGLAFKGGTGDIRESRAMVVVQALIREGCNVKVCDPAAMEHAAAVLPKHGVTFVADPYQAAAGCDALLILTDWAEFAALDLKEVHAKLKHPIVVDGRNLYCPDDMAAAGLFYYSVGRASATPVTPTEPVPPATSRSREEEMTAAPLLSVDQGTR